MCDAVPGVGSPNSKDLPYFAYGAFKQGEPAFELLRQFTREEVPCEVKGSLLIRDGLPLLDVAKGGTVTGSLVFFAASQSEDAYQTIGTFEPKGHYKWHVVRTLQRDAEANTLVGVKLGRGRPSDYEGSSWSFKSDPALTQGLRAVSDMVETGARDEFKSAPPDSFDWPRFFRLQAAYLLLWAAIERYASLAFGPNLNPLDKITRLGSDPAFGNSLAACVTRTGEIYDARDPADVLRLIPGDPRRSIKYYYQVRNNLSHRGKGAWADGEIVRQSLAELTEVFCRMLREKGVRLQAS